MASITFDKSTGWWSVRYYAGPDATRVRAMLCKHPTAWSKSKPPKRPPAAVRELAAPYEDRERAAKAGKTVQGRETDLARYIRDYVAVYGATHRPNSIAALKNATDKFLAWCKAAKVSKIEMVTVQRCDEWLASRFADGAARSTIVTERAYLAPIWAQARRHRVISENPWELARVQGKPKDEDLKYWTVDELKRLFDACEGWVKDFAILDANTGLRVGALTGLTWADVDFGAGQIVVPVHLSKSGKSYTVPFSPTAEAVLARRWLECESKSRGALVFPSRVKKGKIDRSQVWRRLKAAVKRSGIRDFGHYPHALRHSFAVALVGADVSMRVIQDLLGHSSMKTTLIYAKVAASKTREAMDRFDVPDEAKPGKPETPSPDPET